MEKEPQIRKITRKEVLKKLPYFEDDPERFEVFYGVLRMFDRETALDVIKHVTEVNEKNYLS